MNDIFDENHVALKRTLTVVQTFCIFFPPCLSCDVTHSKPIARLQLMRRNYRLWQTVHGQSPWCITELQDKDQSECGEGGKTSGHFSGTESSHKLHIVFTLYRCSVCRRGSQSVFPGITHSSRIHTALMGHCQINRSNTVKLLKHIMPKVSVTTMQICLNF